MSWLNIDYATPVGIWQHSHLKLHLLQDVLTYLSTLTLTHAFEPNYNLFKEERIKGGHKLETLLVSANTDIVMSEMALDVEGFPPVLCILWMNELHTIAVADKLKRYKDKSYRRNKKWLTGTHQQMVTTSASGGGLLLIMK